MPLTERQKRYLSRSYASLGIGGAAVGAGLGHANRLVGGRVGIGRGAAIGLGAGIAATGLKSLALRHGNKVEAAHSDLFRDYLKLNQAGMSHRGVYTGNDPNVASQAAAWRKRARAAGINVAV